jgi:hypothetical protein
MRPSLEMRAELDAPAAMLVDFFLVAARTLLLVGPLIRRAHVLMT